MVSAEYLFFVFNYEGFVLRSAVQTLEQRPEGPVPAHVPLPRNRLNRPVPWAMRGPATAFIWTCPEAETRPAN